MGLGGNIAGNILQAAVGSALSGGSGESSGEWFTLAMDMVGNEGQASLIESIGMNFDDVYDLGVSNDGDFSEVNDLSSYPEAIADILGEVESAMEDKFTAAMAENNDLELSIQEEISLMDAFFF